jgi:hypothetical protein
MAQQKSLAQHARLAALPFPHPRSLPPGEYGCDDDEYVAWLRCQILHTFAACKMLRERVEAQRERIRMSCTEKGAMNDAIDECSG